MSANGDRNLDKKLGKRKVQQRFTATADWGTVDAVLIRDAITAVTRGGAAIRFGYSRDGGAYAIGILDGDEKYTLWAKPAPSDELDITLGDIITGYDGERSAPTA